MSDVAGDLFSSGETKFLGEGNRPIIYGSNNNNVLSANDSSKLNSYLNPYKGNGIIIIGGQGKDLIYDSSTNNILMGGADADSYLFTGTFGNDEVKDSGKGDKLYIDNTHITGEAYETAAGSGIYTLEDITVTQAGNGIKLTTGGGTITLLNWSEGGYGISLIEKEEQQQRLTQGPSLLVINGSVPLQGGGNASLRYEFPTNDPAAGEMYSKVLAALVLSGAGLFNEYVADTELEAALFSNYFTPLVFDLDGDGVTQDLLPIYWAFGRFDLNNDGYAEPSGWVKPDDGFLVRDVNGNGVIDNVSEMFGTYGGQTAWQRLALLDNTNDGKLSSADSAWSSLKVWRDGNINNYSEAHELVSLNSVGIYGISTAKQAFTQAPSATNKYNQIDGKGVWYTAQGGIGGEYLDVLFKTNKQFTEYVGTNLKANLAVNPSVVSLPELGNLANVPYLHYAASQNPRIASLLTMLDASDPAIDWSYSAKVVSTLLIEWAGNTAMDSASLGPYIDARIAQTLRELLGLDPYTQSLTATQATNALKNWDALVEKMQQRLMAQSFDEIFNASYYDYTNDWVKTEDSATDIILNARFLQPDNLLDKVAYWENIIKLVDSQQFDIPNSSLLNAIEMVVMSEAGIYVSTGALDNEKQIYYAFSPTETTYNTATAALDTPLFIVGNSLGNTISTSNKKDFIDAVSGNNTIDGRAGIDVLTFSGANGVNINFNTKVATYNGFTSSFNNIEGAIGSAGNDVLYGSNAFGSASTSYLVGMGGNDTITSGLGGDSSLTFIDGGAGKDSITMNGGGNIIFSDYTDSSSVGNMQDIIYGYSRTFHSINVEALGYTGITDIPFYARDGMLLVSYNAATNKTTVSDNFWSDFEFQLDGAFSASQLSMKFAKPLDVSALDRSFFDYIGSPESDTIGADIVFYNSLTHPEGSVLVGVGGHDTVMGGIGNDTIYIKDTFEAAEEEEFYSFVSPGDGDDVIIISGNGNLKINGSAGNDTYIINGTGTVSFWKDGHDWSGDRFYLGDEVIPTGGYYRPSTTVYPHTNYLYNIGQGFVGEYDNGFFRIYKEATNSSNIFIEHAPYTWTQTNELGMSFIKSNNLPAFGAGKIGTITQNPQSAWLYDVVENIDYNTDTMASLLNIAPLTRPASYVAPSLGKTITTDTVYPLTLGTDGNDSIAGTANADTLLGGQGNDTIDAKGGQDTLYGLSGADLLQGGSGNDTLFGGFGNDTLEGNSDNDVIYGDNGDDSITGSTGSDTLLGGAGADIIKGDSGNDSINGGSENDDIKAGDGDDTIAAGIGNDTIEGGLGFDTIYGEAGNDLLDGNSSNDLLNGDDGQDTVFGSEGNDTLYGGNENDSLNGGTGTDNVYGDAGNDYVIGDMGGDNVYGGIGNDTVDGGEGKDNLYGGTGADIFFYNALTDSLNTNPDRIKDFEDGSDKIHLKGLGFTGVVAGAAVGTTLGYTQTSTLTTISDAGTFQFIIENGTITLTNADFVFV
jgi:Ca2+-binding RTX toxin-like protein